MRLQAASTYGTSPTRDYAEKTPWISIWGKVMTGKTVDRGRQPQWHTHKCSQQHLFRSAGYAWSLFQRREFYDCVYSIERRQWYGITCCDFTVRFNFCSSVVTTQYFLYLVPLQPGHWLDFPFHRVTRKSKHFQNRTFISLIMQIT